MLLLAPARIADGLREGTLPERSKFHLLLLTSVLGLLFGRRIPIFTTNGDLLLAGLFMAVALLGLWSCYRANGGANGRGIVERFMCLGVPVGIWLYGGYYLLYYGAYLVFRPNVAGADPHFSSRLNGWSVTTSLMAMVVYYWILSRYIRRSAGDTSIGHEAAIPNPALSPLGWLIGVWNTVGTHPLVPNTIFHGRTSFDWLAGGAFLRIRSEIDEPDIPSGTAIIGSDDAVGQFSMLYFDERGVSRRYEVAVEESSFTWWRDAPGFRQRYTCTLAENGNTFHGQGELSRDGSTWEGDLELTYTRAT